MIPKYDLPTIVYPSRMDSSGRLSIPDCFAMFMDIAAPHAAMLGCGTEDLAKKDLFWLTVKSKIRILRRPYMMEDIVVSTWPEQPQESRCNRDYSITKGEETLVLGKTLWAVVNMKTGKLHRVDELYPEGFQAFPDVSIEEPFISFDRVFTGEPFAEYTVRPTDIDFGGHMNNIAYIRAVTSFFSSKEWQEMNVTEMEIQYKSPCFEGDVIHFERKTVGDYMHLCGKRENGKVAVYIAIKE